MQQFKDTLFVSPLGSFLWKFSELQNLINKCVVLDIHHCAVGSHWRRATRLVFGGQSDRACFHSPFFLTGSDVTESMVFVASAKGTNICSCARHFDTTIRSLQGSWWIHDTSEIVLTLPLKTSIFGEGFGGPTMSSLFV